MSLVNETIAAIATPRGRGGIGIIRISGLEAFNIAQKILGFVPEPRKSIHAAFLSQSGQSVDEGIALFFKAPNSFTGEDTLELQGHGGPVVMDLLLEQVLLNGARLARPGEFSERAFLNDKIDLTQAEAIADLIDANSAAAARCAIRSLQGEFSRQINSILGQLIQLRLYIEASIDFPTEEIDFISESSVQQDLQSLIFTLEKLYSTAQQGELMREGINLVIAGKPNAGKSSLLNSLSGRDAAIVTEIAGTTRDTLKEYLQIDGIPIQIFDTAGLRITDDKIEQEGMRRTHLALQQADVILWIMDAQDTDFAPPTEIFNNHQVPVVIIKNKIDLLNEIPGKSQFFEYPCIALSAKYQQGLEILKIYLRELLGITASSEGVFTARRRHLQALEKALHSLKTGQQALVFHQSSELLAEDLKQAQLSLGEITGEFTADDLLGKIFSSFCIGK